MIHKPKHLMENENAEKKKKIGEKKRMKNTKK